MTTTWLIIGLIKRKEGNKKKYNNNLPGTQNNYMYKYVNGLDAVPRGLTLECEIKPNVEDTMGIQTRWLDACSIGVMLEVGTARGETSWRIRYMYCSFFIYIVISCYICALYL